MTFQATSKESTSPHSRIPTWSLQLVNEEFLRASAQLCCPLFSCSKGCPRGKRLPARQKEPGWCEDLRGVVTFPLPEAHPCSARPAAHAPLAPHTPVPVHVLRDGGFTDTLPSSTPLQGKHVSTAWEEALTLHRWTLKDVWGIATSPHLSFLGFGEMAGGEGEREEVKCRNLSVPLNKILKGVLSLKKQSQNRAPYFIKQIIIQVLRLEAPKFTETESKKLYPKALPSSALFPVRTKWLKHFGPNLAKAPSPTDSNRLCWLLTKQQTWSVQDVTQWALLKNLLKESSGLLQSEKHAPKNIFFHFLVMVSRTQFFLSLFIFICKQRKGSNP